MVISLPMGEKNVLIWVNEAGQRRSTARKIQMVNLCQVAPADLRKKAAFKKSKKHSKDWPDNLTDTPAHNKTLLRMSASTMHD